jgi:hypothetical protein
LALSVRAETGKKPVKSSDCAFQCAQRSGVFAQLTQLGRQFQRIAAKELDLPGFVRFAAAHGFQFIQLSSVIAVSHGQSRKIQPASAR